MAVNGTIERELQLLKGGLAAMVGEGRLQDAIGDYKWKRETYMRKCGIAPRVCDIIEGFIGDPVNEIITLEDVAQHPRDEIAAIEGVGPTSMENLDAAMAERGLTWAEAA